jgi:hypothetical protein
LTPSVQRWIASEAEQRNALRRATATFFLAEGPFFRVLGNPSQGIHPAGFPAFTRTASSRASGRPP